MAVNVIRLHEICKDKDLLLIKLREWKLIPNEINCKKCNGILLLCEDKSR